MAAMVKAGSWNQQKTPSQAGIPLLLCDRLCKAEGVCGWDGKDLDVSDGGLQSARAGLAALRGAPWPRPRHMFSSCWLPADAKVS